METKPKNIPMLAVKSGQISEIGHEGDTLAVQFKNGTTYHYHGVSAEDFAKFQKAESLGKHLQTNIKPAFKFSKIREKSDESN